MATSHKYKIEDQINDWKIIGYECGSGTPYVCECKCGYVVSKTAQNLKISKRCRKCSCLARTNKHIGKIYGNLTVLETVQEGNKSKIKVRCNHCSNEFYTYKSKIQNRKWCHNCIRGLYPGKVLKNITLIERAGNGLWKIRCECGKIFTRKPAKYNGRYPSCGCRKRNERLNKAQKKIGFKYKHLKINKIIGVRNNHIIFQLKCSCGNFIERPNGNEFKSQSCGCKRSENCAKGEKKSCAKLTKNDVLTIRDFHQNKVYTDKEIEQIFNISYSNLRLIITRKRWKHV